MITFLVVVGCIAVFYGGCWLAARHAPIECDTCGLLIAHDEYDSHVVRCAPRRVVEGEPAALGTTPHLHLAHDPTPVQTARLDQLKAAHLPLTPDECRRLLTELGER